MADLVRLRAATGWSQTRMAKELGVSQGHLSRLLRGLSRPRPSLERRIEALAAREGAVELSLEALGKRVARAARRSPEFRTLVETALHLCGR